MGGGATERAIAAQAAYPLTAAQVRDLILAANRAWKEQRRYGLADEPFDVWRRAALHDACGRQSFRDVRQGEYGRVRSYLERLAGRKAPARRASGKPQAADEADRARWALERECAAQADAFGGLDGAEAYADALLGCIHKTTRGLATAKQLWQVLFTLRNRAATKRRRNAPDAF